MMMLIDLLKQIVNFFKPLGLKRKRLNKAEKQMMFTLMSDKKAVVQCIDIETIVMYQTVIDSVELHLDLWKMTAADVIKTDCHLILKRMIDDSLLLHPNVVRLWTRISLCDNKIVVECKGYLNKIPDLTLMLCHYTEEVCSYTEYKM